MGQAALAPPHSLEAEQSVLGAVLLSDKVHYAYVIEEGLRADDFYRERHQVIYQSMLDLYNESEPIDVVTVTEHLRARGRAGRRRRPRRDRRAHRRGPAVGNLRRYGSIVREMSLLRKLLTTTYEIQSSVHNHEALPRDIVEQAEKAMLEVGRDDRQKDFRKVGEVLHEELDRWHELLHRGQVDDRHTSGFVELDEMTGGFQPGNMIIVAARPSMGKCCVGSTLVYDLSAGIAAGSMRVVRDVGMGAECFVASLGPGLQAAKPRAYRIYAQRRQARVLPHHEARASHRGHGQPPAADRARLAPARRAGPRRSDRGPAEPPACRAPADDARLRAGAPRRTDRRWEPDQPHTAIQLRLGLARGRHDRAGSTRRGRAVQGRQAPAPPQASGAPGPPARIGHRALPSSPHLGQALRAQVRPRRHLRPRRRPDRPLPQRPLRV